MDRKTYDALIASIEKWEGNAAVRRIASAQVYGDSCPLCDLFWRWNAACEGCPVRNATGCSECAGSPWKDVIDAYFDFKRGAVPLRIFRDAAAREVNFLRSLVPAGGPEE